MRAVSKALYRLISVEFVSEKGQKPFCKSELQVRKATSVYDMVRGMAHGATSGVEGVSGSLGPRGFARILNSVDGGIYGKRFFDAGCGCGIPVLTATALGAHSGTGVDTPDNLPVFSRIFMNGRTRLGISPAKANLGFCDISKMVSIQHKPNLVYTFWESMGPDTRENILRMTSICTVFACINAPGETIKAVCSTLNKFSPEGKVWNLADNFSTTAVGGMQRQVWIFKRHPATLSINMLKSQSLDFPSDLLVSILKPVCVCHTFP